MNLAQYQTLEYREAHSYYGLSMFLEYVPAYSVIPTMSLSDRYADFCQRLEKARGRQGR